MRTRPHRQLVRIPDLRRKADIVAIAETDCCRPSPRRVSGAGRLPQPSRPGPHGTTFGGGPLACRVALEYLAIVEEEKLLENVSKVGAYLQHELQQLVDGYAAAKEVRGRGFIQGIDLEIPTRPIVEQGLAQGVLFNSTQDTVCASSPFLPGAACRQGHPRTAQVSRQKASQGGVKNGEPKLPITQKRQRRYHLHRLRDVLKSCPPPRRKAPCIRPLRKICYRAPPSLRKNDLSLLTVLACATCKPDPGRP